MKQWLSFLILGCLILCASTSHAGPRKLAKQSKDRQATLQLYSWQTSLVGDGSVKGMTVNFENESSFSKKNKAGGVLTFPVTENIHLSLGYNGFDHTGTINRGVSFESLNYQTGANLRLKNDWVDVTGGYQISKSETGYWDFLFGGKIGQSKIDISGFDAAAKPISGSWSQKYPIPHLGLGAGMKMADNIFVDGSLKFMSLSVGQGNITSYDLDVNLAYKLNTQPKTKQGWAIPVKSKNQTDSEWFATVGFRKFLVDGSFDKDSVKIGYSGPMAGIQGRF